MSYRIRQSQGGWGIELLDESPFCSTLNVHTPLAPDELRDEWLLLIAAVWSERDRAAIQRAIQAAHNFNGRIHLGVAVFDRYEEVSQWMPRVKFGWGTPIWMFFRSGSMINLLQGDLNEQQLMSALSSFIASRPDDDGPDRHTG